MAAQEAIEADYDLTIVYVAGKSFAFILDRKTFSGLDWRKLINKEEMDWKRFQLEPEFESSIMQYMNEAKYFTSLSLQKGNRVL